MFQLSQLDIAATLAVLSAIFVLFILSYIGKLKATIDRQSKALGEAYKDAKLYKDAIIAHQSYAGNDFTTFAGYPTNTLYERTSDRQTFVLISRSDLHGAVADAFQKGHGMQTDLTAALRSVVSDLDLNEPVPEVPKLKMTAINPKLDNDFSLFVNELRDIAVKYGNTGQLRIHFSGCVHAFRDHMVQRQAGHAVTPFRYGQAQA